jgi:acyl-CoA synthetase (AMP-forming)/AMP-acid ligase II
MSVDPHSAPMSGRVPARWGEELQVEQVGHRQYRMYRPRVHRIEHLLEYCDWWGRSPHLIQGDTTVAFSDIPAAARARASALRTAGVARGDRVGIIGWNSPSWVLNIWATWSAGAVPVLVNAWWSPHEVEEAFEQLDPAVVLADQACQARVPSGYPVAPWDLGDEAGGDLTVGAHVGELDENAPALVIFTSGSAGRPKAVVLSHRSLIAGLHALLAVTKRLPQYLADAPGSVALHTGPLFHVGGIQTIIRSVVVGETIVFPEGKFDPDVALDLIEHHGVTRWSAVPTMLTRVLDAQAEHPRDLQSLRSLTIGGAPAHPAMYQRVRNELPMVKARVATGYGLTENGGQATAASGTDTRDRPGTCGRPLPPVEIRIDAGASDAEGEILIRAASQMTEYYG